MIFSAQYVAQLQAIGPGDAVLMFGVENGKELRIICRHIRARRKTIFLWNPVRDYQQQSVRKLSRYVHALKRLDANVATFDPVDAQVYDFQLVEQVYRDVSPWIKPEEDQDIDLYFVGQDKGRLPDLLCLREMALAAGLTVHFHVTPDKRKTYTETERRLLSDKPLTYSENLQLVNRARCLEEIVQSNQSGETIRSLEAAFFDRKLLTNRHQAVQDALHADDRVLIGGWCIHLMCCSDSFVHSMARWTGSCSDSMTSCTGAASLAADTRQCGARSSGGRRALRCEVCG